jgi:hypothetical protein
MTLLPPPRLSPLFTLRCAVDPPMEIGKGPYGRRRCVPIVSGTVAGRHLNGEVVPGGADFMYVWIYCQRPSYLLLRLVEEDHTTHVNTNYVVKSDDGAYLYLR